MRAALPTLGVLLLAIGLTACHKPARNADLGGGSGSPAAKTLTIQNGEAPAPPAPKVAGGKLAVMDNAPDPGPAKAPPLAAPPISAAPARSYAHTTSEPRGAGDDESEYGPAQGDNGEPPLTRRDCQRAERNGDFLADSRACRVLMAPRPAADPQLGADCREARDIGDPFASSRVCRALLDR
jgi:hypothetical protein